MRIVVSSNCQTGGLTAGLRILLPNVQVDPHPYGGLDEVGRQALIQDVANADVWVCTAPAKFVSMVTQSCDSASLRLVTLPELYFDAFHPDLVYAWLPDNITLDTATGPYNSAIALWAWRRGLSPGQTIDLFTPSVFEGLGYHDRWDLSTARLRADFAAHPGLDPGEFVRVLQRKGPFMHTVNHPKSSALAELARQLASQLGSTPELLAEPIDDFMPDALMTASVVWPMYPSIANSLGFVGSFTWKLADQSVIRLEEFIERSFESYRLHATPGFACHQLDWPMYDPILSEATNGKC